MKEILFTSSVLIGVILLVRRLFRGRVSHILLYAAWLLVAARLLIPFQFGQWNMSIATLTDRMEAQSQTVRRAQELLQEPVSGPSRQEVYQQLTQEYTQQGLDPARPEVQEEMLLQMEQRLTAPTLSQVLTAVWAAGAAVMVVWFLTVNLVFLRKAKQGAVPYPANLPVRVRISAHVPTPCLVGLFRPVIYLTPECAATPEMTRHVLTHELTHLRHRDPVWSLVRCACLCVYWFDPLVWIAAAQSRRDCELACDEGALRVLGSGERIAYGQTLLITVSRSLSPARLLQTATAMSESKKQLKERVCFIVKKPKNLLIAVICFLLISTLTAGCAFTGGIIEPPETTDSPNTTGPTETAETIGTDLRDLVVSYTELPFPETLSTADHLFCCYQNASQTLFSVCSDNGRQNGLTQKTEYFALYNIEGSVTLFPVGTDAYITSALPYQDGVAYVDYKDLSDGNVEWSVTLKSGSVKTVIDKGTVSSYDRVPNLYYVQDKPYYLREERDGFSILQITDQTPTVVYSKTGCYVLNMEVSSNGKQFCFPILYSRGDFPCLLIFDEEGLLFEPTLGRKIISYAITDQYAVCGLGDEYTNYADVKKCYVKAMDLSTGQEKTLTQPYGAPWGLTGSGSLCLCVDYAWQPYAISIAAEQVSVIPGPKSAANRSTPLFFYPAGESRFFALSRQNTGYVFYLLTASPA